MPFLALAAALWAATAGLCAVSYPTPEDADGDGVAQAAEKAIAQGLMPELEWAKGEPCGEHRTLYQVHPLSAARVRVVFALVFPVDCGFRGTGIGGHPGDVQELSVTAVLEGGGWTPVSVDLPWHRPFEPKSWPARLLVSAGKHHIYPDKKGCNWGRFLFFDRCGGGPREIAALRPEDNVGERAAPLVMTLAPLGQGRFAAGYAGENAWGRSAWNDKWFCGGDPQRGREKSMWTSFKRLFGISPCGDALDGKWDRDPSAL